jgi:hypothetical protein
MSSEFDNQPGHLSNPGATDESLERKVILQKVSLSLFKHPALISPGEPGPGSQRPG